MLARPPLLNPSRDIIPDVAVGAAAGTGAGLASLAMFQLMGEKSCAFIVASQPIKPVALRRHLRELGVAEFKLPDRITCVDALPLTPVGKVDKKRLRQQLADQQAQA